MFTVTGILRVVKVKSVKGIEDRGYSLGVFNLEISKFLVQFLLKFIETFKIFDNKMVLEEIKVIKDFLQNSMFSGFGFKEFIGLGLFLLLLFSFFFVFFDKFLEFFVQKRQFLVFVKICFKFEVDFFVEGYFLIGEWDWGKGQ